MSGINQNIEPINYATQVLSPVQDILQGYNSVLASRDATNEFNLKNAQQQQAVQFHNDLRSISGNPNRSPQDIINLGLRYPNMMDPLKKTYDLMNEDQQKSLLSTGVQIISALKNKNNDIAKGIVDKAADAAENSGQKSQAEAYRALSDQIVKDPDHAFTTSSALLGGAIGPENFTKIMNDINAQDISSSNIEKTRSEIDKNKADAKKFLNDANYKQEEIKIEKMKIALGKENNAIRKRDLSQKISDKQKLLSDSDNEVKNNATEALSTLADILSPENSDSLKTASGASSFIGLIPGTKARAIRGKIDQLKTQSAMTQIKQFKNRLNLNEWKAIQNAKANLDPAQDEESLNKNLVTIGNAFIKSGADVSQIKPFPGMILNGHKFLGGDPGSQDSWKKL